MTLFHFVFSFTYLGMILGPFQLRQVDLNSSINQYNVHAQEEDAPDSVLKIRGVEDRVEDATLDARVVFLPLVTRSSPETWHMGEGTYYDATGAGNCSFDPSPEDLMVAAMNQTDYANAALCGAYIEVEGPKGIVTVRIVDRCPECASGDVDMSPEAFALIADLVAGRVPIRWRIVGPEMQGPIVYRFKEGSNQWWTAVQIRNHRNPVAKVEYGLSNGEFKAVPRTNYNYFVDASGMGPGPYTFRVTDMYGNVLQDAGIPHIEGGEVAGGAQFPPAP
ncbi:MAG TPA: expansin EXLX1 family cellulose-binding protein [Anaerolineales bacterium]